ncbi:MAG TPA: LysM peptidoglycan-binding domain-containing protein, partial [Arenibaculum sp.]|nr:LysM peptidoglycan-binding domain-containing protein [Arenibaculum sp.]
MMRLAFACACVLVSAGCAQQRTGGPAPVTFGAQAVAPSAAGAVTVAAGDTLYEISRRYEVPVRELIELNRLEAPYLLRVGQRLALPTARFHVVRPGDTLYAVSRMYQADMAELARVNGLAHPYHIRVGQPLRLPGANGAETRVAIAPEPARKPGSDAPAVAALPAEPPPAAVVQPLPPAAQPLPQPAAQPLPPPAVPSVTAQAAPMVRPPSKPEP